MLDIKSLSDRELVTLWHCTNPSVTEVLKGSVYDCSKELAISVLQEHKSPMWGLLEAECEAREVNPRTFEKQQVVTKKEGKPI